MSIILAVWSLLNAGFIYIVATTIEYRHMQAGFSWWAACVNPAITITAAWFSFWGFVKVDRD